MATLLLFHHALGQTKGFLAFEGRSSFMRASRHPTGTSWPERVPLQIHVMDADELGDVDVARVLVEEIQGADVFLYAGSGHLLADPGLDDYDEEAAALLRERTLAFLDRVG